MSDNPQSSDETIIQSSSSEIIESEDVSHSESSSDNDDSSDDPNESEHKMTRFANGTKKEKYSGKAGGIELSFSNLYYSVPAKRTIKQKLLRKKLPNKVLIKNVSGKFTRGRLVAIMGPSGAGKTTLLSLLSGRVSGGKGSKVKGEVTANGISTHLLGDRYKEALAFVMQDDVMLSNLTPRQLIRFAALLRLDRNISKKDKYEKVERLIKDLGLTKCADTRVGQAGVQRGISGGERKRVAIGMELVTDPEMIFLDEPTSGLDSTTALIVIKILQRLAHDTGKTIVITIHQPSSEIFFCFDDLYLLSEGNIVFGGPVTDAVDHFAKLGLPCPKYSNPADHLLNAASPSWKERLNFKNMVVRKNKDKDENDQDEEEDSESDGEASAFLKQDTSHDRDENGIEYEEDNKKEFDEDLKNMIKARNKQFKSLHPEDYEKAKQANDAKKKGSDRRKAFVRGVSHLAQSFKHSKVDNSIEFRETRTPLRIYEQFFLLLLRQFIQTYRSPDGTIKHLVSTIISSLFIGIIFLQLKNNQRGSRDRLGAMFIIMLSQIFSNAQITLITFPAERPLFIREYANRMYSIFAYYMAKSLTDIPNLIIFPILYATITYWLIGFQQEADKFFVWVMFIIILCWLGQAFGFALSSGLDLQQALPLLPVLTIPLSLLGGFFLNPDSTPVFLIWIQYISFFYWAFQGIVVNEFDEGLTFYCDDVEYVIDSTGAKTCPILDGSQVIDMLDFGSATIWRSVLVLIGWYLFLRMLSFLFLFMVARKKTAS